MLPAGLVLTGGAAQLAGAARLGREVLQMPVRVAGPSGVSGLTDHLLTPAYSTSLGLLMWGAQTVHGDELARVRIGARAGRPGPHARLGPRPAALAQSHCRASRAGMMRAAAASVSRSQGKACPNRPLVAGVSCRSNRPLDDAARASSATEARTEITVHTGSRRGLFDITRECADFVSGEGDGLLNVFVPHATCGRRDHGAGRRLRHRPHGRARPAAAARRSLASRPWLARPRRRPRAAAARPAVAERAGCRRPSCSWARGSRSRCSIPTPTTRRGGSR